MAKTLLNAVNEVGKLVGMIAGDASEFSSLTDSARQRGINVAVNVINRGILDLYTNCGAVMPSGQGQSTLTLATATRSYALASDCVRVLWPMIDKTNSQFLHLYRPGYNQMLKDDPEQDDTGLPHHGVVSPVDGYVFLDRAPTSVENGRVYTYQYEKDLELSAASDTMPFADTIFRSMVPAWVQLWLFDMRNREYDERKLKMALGQAAQLLPKVKPRMHYNPRVY